MPVGAALFYATARLIPSRVPRVDVPRYHMFASMLLSGHAPYQGFPFEYPPFSLAAFVPPLLLAGPHASAESYAHCFLLESTVWIAIIVACLERIATMLGRGPNGVFATLGTYLLFCVLAAPFAPWYFDLFPAALTVLALLALLSGRPGWAGVWLGLGVASKLYPVVLVPLGIAYLGLRARHALARFAFGFAGALAAVLLPFALRANFGGLAGFLRYHVARGLEIESLAASLLLFRRDAGIVFDFGSFNLRGSPATHATVAGLPWLFLAAYAWLLVTSYQRFRETTGQSRARALVDASVAALLAFILMNKVLSPQYLVWVLPFVALLGRGPRCIAAFAVATTTYLWPYHFGDLIHLRAFEIGLLAARNLALLSIAAMTAWHGRDAVARIQGRPGSTSRDEVVVTNDLTRVPLFRNGRLRSRALRPEERGSV